MYLYLYFNPDKFSDDSKALNRKLPLKRNFRKARTVLVRNGDYYYEAHQLYATMAHTSE